MNIQRRPIEDAVVLLGVDADDSYFGMLPQDDVAHARPPSRFIQRHYHQVGIVLSTVFGVSSSVATSPTISMSG
jgi:hypothetical protein